MNRRSSRSLLLPYTILFFFNDTATTEIYTLSLHDAHPIYRSGGIAGNLILLQEKNPLLLLLELGGVNRSEEHTSELQSQSNLVCRLLLEKKKKQATQQLTRYLLIGLRNRPLSYDEALCHGT